MSCRRVHVLWEGACIVGGRMSCCKTTDLKFLIIVLFCLLSSCLPVYLGCPFFSIVAWLTPSMITDIIVV